MPTENAIVETSLIQEKKHKKNKDKKKEKKRRHESDAESNSKKQKSDKGSKPSKKGSKSSVWTYEQHPDLTQLNASIVDEFMKKNAIQTQALGDSGVDLRPIMEFSQVTFPEMLQSSLSSFKNPTPIQAISWPFLLKGKDVIGIAATGSGKTVAFGIPALMHIYNKRAQNKQSSGTMVLVLSPTRELAIQIQEQIIKFGEALKLSSICLYGGVSKGDQIRQLKQWNHQPDVIVATPGRLLDLMNDGHVRLSSVDFFVLDEADRMLDLGFEPDIRRIVAELPKERQTVMFSATWPVSIQQLSQKYLNNPIKITVGSQDLSANVNITQHVEVMEPHAKDGRLLQLLKQIHNRKNRILIFALYKKEAERLEQFVLNKGFKAAGIHGNLNQHQRTQAIQSFRDGSTPLLIATDVAARGLDIPNVEYVINYTYPLTTEEYCHRIGRTGRAGNTGTSYTFFTMHDKSHSGALINVLKQAKQQVPDDLMKFGTTVKKKLDPNYGAFVKEGVDLNKKGTKITFDDSDDE